MKQFESYVIFAGTKACVSRLTLLNLFESYVIFAGTKACL